MGGFTAVVVEMLLVKVEAITLTKRDAEKATKEQKKQ